MTLVEFLTARYDEIAEVAAAAGVEGGPIRWQMWTSLASSVADQRIGPRGSVEAAPAYVLADVESKRAIVSEYVNAAEWANDPLCSSPDSYQWRAGVLADVLRYLAQPFADHPDFDPAWAVR